MPNADLLINHRLLHHDVDNVVWYDDNLLDFFTFNELLYVFVG